MTLVCRSPSAYVRHASDTCGGCAREPSAKSTKLERNFSYIDAAATATTTKCNPTDHLTADQKALREHFVFSDADFPPLPPSDRDLSGMIPESVCATLNFGHLFAPSPVPETLILDNMTTRAPVSPVPTRRRKRWHRSDTAWPRRWLRTRSRGHRDRDWRE